MAAAGALLAGALSVVAWLALHVALNCPISPVPSPPPAASSSWHGCPANNLLQRAEKLGEGRLDGPEDVLVDAAGTVYTATRDGWLQRMYRNGSWEWWRFVGGAALLGITPSADGSMLVCDADKGLLRVGEDGVTVLATEVEGSKIRFADAAIEASDGTVYFSDASTRLGLDDWFLDYIEGRPSGRLLRYDPRTGTAAVVLADLAFPNGVALSPHEDFLVVCETFRFRCLKLWLRGEKAGQTEIFVGDLPGGPDNIRLSPDGSFWIALLQLRSPLTDLVGRWSLAKRVLASFPALVEKGKSTLLNGARVAQVLANGTVVRVLDDAEGKVVNFVTTATEFDGNLFLGSLSANFIGRLALT